MWKKFVIEDKTFVIRMSIDDNDNYEIMMSDFSKFWVESLNNLELLNRCKELNPLYEAEPDVLVKRVKELIEPDKENVIKGLLEVGNQLTLSFSSYLNGVLFRFQFILVISAPEKFCQHMTFPLIQMIEELQARQKKLCDLLMRKDAEINEYKMEGVKLTRKNVITEVFCEEKFLESCSDDAETRSLASLQCPFTYFEESCSNLYEECTKRKKVIEEALSSKKKNLKEEKEVEAEKNVKPEMSKRKKTHELVFADKEDDTDNDETYFSNEKVEVKTAVKLEGKKSLANKKKNRLNL